VRGGAGVRHGDRFVAYPDPAGRLAGRYHKRHLVMFGEYVPWVEALPFIKWFTPITGGFTPGDRVTHFELNRWGGPPREPRITTSPTNSPPEVSPRRPIKTAALICFEDTFPQLVREYVDADTDFLVNLTNNGWFGVGAAQWQHGIPHLLRLLGFAMARPLR